MTLHDMPRGWTVLTPETGHYLFGYYDRCPWDMAIQRHLALRIPQQERLSAPGETAEVGYVDRDERRFVKVADTEAWCHQQGAMTLWLQHRPGTFVYNDFVKDGGTWRPIARIHDLQHGPAGEYDRPLYAISPDGRWGATLNFGRIPRRGYTYARAVLAPGEEAPDLDGDGLFLVDLHDGSSRLIASYRQMLEAHPLPYDAEDAYMWLNHTIFNRDGTRLMVLLRFCDSPDKPGPWRTYMFTMRLDGTELQCPLSNIHWQRSSISHQIWGHRPDDVLVDADWCGRGSEYVLFDVTRPFRGRRISRGMGPHSHLVFSPDGRLIAADTYSHDGMQRLSIVDAETGALSEIGRFRHQPAVALSDVRCDLHPRWSQDGRVLTIDTIHEGERKIYLWEMDA